MTTSAPRPPVRSRTQATRSAARRIGDVEDVVGAESYRGLEPRLRSADDEDRERAGELREDRGVQAHGAAPLDDDGVAHRDAGALDGVKAGRQAAAASHEIERVDSLGQRQDLDSRQDLDPLGPSAEEPVSRRGRDAVDAPVRAARGGLRDEAVPAVAAGAEDVEEGDERSGLDRASLDVEERPVRFEDAAAIDVPRDDRVRHAGEPPVVEMDVGSADLARDQSRARRRPAWPRAPGSAGAPAGAPARA